MKKFFLCVAAAVFAVAGVHAQKGEKSAGVSLGYGSEIKSIGIGARFNYGITDRIRVTPGFTYFFPKDGFSAWETNADVHYLFPVTGKVTVYPLAGLTFTGWKFDAGNAFGDLGGLGDVLGDYLDNASSDITRFGVNLGGGIQYRLTGKLSIGAEAKYSLVSEIDQIVAAAVLTYKF
ncbi:hypothetical protein Barb4_00408 [Bacteroidales bacterium Barb4]|nr:hypothetical protein Barb4_00408 [Bacteroidales bacterium Barb4]